MNILAVSDVEQKSLWDFFDPDQVKDVDLIISCGDLQPAYLEFLVTMINRPLLYVRGNHDDHYENRPPEGCICIEDQIYVYQGLRIMGLGGSMCYKSSGNQYTEPEMEKRIRRLKRKLKRSKGIDLFVTHAPAKGYGDMEDPAHRGFACFNDILEEYRPDCMLHGHVHQEYGWNQKELMHPSGTRIINVCGSQRVMLDVSAAGDTGVFA